MHVGNADFQIDIFLSSIELHVTSHKIMHKQKCFLATQSNQAIEKLSEEVLPLTRLIMHSTSLDLSEQ